MMQFGKQTKDTLSTTIVKLEYIKSEEDHKMSDI